MNDVVIARKGQLIQDALLGLTRRYPAKHVFVYGFMDYLSALFQSDVVIVLWRKKPKGGFEPWFTNCHEPLRREALSGYPFCLAHLEEALIEGEINLHASHSCRVMHCPQAKGIAITVVYIEAVKKQDPDCALILRSLEQIEKLLNSALAGRQANPIWTQIRYCADPAIHPLIPASNENHFTDVAQAVVDCEARDTSWHPELPNAPATFLSAITNFVDRYLQPKQGFLPLMHPCIRSAEVHELRKGRFPYTIRYLVTDGLRRFVIQKLSTTDGKRKLEVHRAALEDISDAEGAAIAARLKELIRDLLTKEPGSADKFFSILGEPLGSDSLSLADCCFSSGCTQFGQSLGDEMDEPAGEKDRLRRYAEELILMLESTESNCEARLERRSFTFFMPIHVSGCPWLAVFTTTGPDSLAEEKLWETNYHLYRDVLLDFGNAVRQAVVPAYFDAINLLFEWIIPETSTNRQTLERYLDSQLAAIARVCPLPRISVISDCDDVDSPFTIRTVRHGFIRCSVTPNPFYECRMEQPIEFDDLAPTAIAKRCSSLAEAAWNAELSREAKVVAFTSHLIGKPLTTLVGYVDQIPDRDERTAAEHLLARITSFNRFCCSEGHLNDTGLWSEVRSLVGSACENSLKRWNETERSGRSPVQLRMFGDDVDGIQRRVSYSTEYISALMELMASNAVRHGGGQYLDVVFSRDDLGSLVEATFSNQIRSEKFEALAALMPAFNRGTVKEMGIGTIHAGTHRFFNVSARFSLIPMDDVIMLFQTTVPIARHG